MDADKDNPASWKTMEALGGRMIREFYDDENAHCIVRDYEIEVIESINKHKEYYETMMEEKT